MAQKRRRISSGYGAGNRMAGRQNGRTAQEQRRFEAERRTAVKRRTAAENRQTARRGGQSAAARRKRRRKRLIKALAAWAACILVMAGVAAGTVRAVRAVTTGKRSELRREGLEKLAQGDYSGAISSFDAALEQAGDKAVEFNTDVLCYRAEAEQDLKDYQAAAYTYNLLADMDADNAAAYGYLEAVCFGAAGDEEQAYQAYQDARQADQGEEHAPGWLEGLQAAGGALVSAGQYERAMALYEEALAEGAENGQIYNQMGLCQMADADYEGARDSFDKGYALASAQAGGQGAAVSGGQDAAAQDGREMPKGAAASGESLLKELSFNRAAVREYLGQYDEALSLFQAYVSAYGEDERAQYEIDFLETRV